MALLDSLLSRTSAWMSLPSYLACDVVDAASLQTMLVEVGSPESVFLSVKIREFLLQLTEDLQDSLDPRLLEVGENPVVRAYWSALTGVCRAHLLLCPRIGRMTRTGDWMPAAGTRWLLALVTREIMRETWCLHVDTILRSSG